MANHQDGDNSKNASETVQQAIGPSPWEEFWANVRAKGFQFTLREMMVYVGLFALACGLTKWSGSPMVAAACAVGGIAWIMLRFLHARLPGVIVFCMGAWCLGSASWTWVADGFDMACGAAFGLVLIVISLVVFILTSGTHEEEKKWHLGNAWLVFLLMIAWMLFVPRLGTQAVKQRVVRETAANNAAMRDAVALVEAVRKQLGRAPTEEEFDRLAGKPLPKIQDGGYTAEIFYDRTGKDRYRLCFVYSLMYYTYDSGTPKRGWLRST